MANSSSANADAVVIGVFQRVFSLAPQQIRDDTRRGDFEQWDSLGHLNLLEALQSELGITIDVEDALAMETVADVKRVVRQRLQ